MAKKAAGERSVKVGDKTVTLRLDIGTIMDLEDHLDQSFLEWTLNNLVRLKISDFAMLYLAMTGGDFTDKDKCREAGTMLYDNGFVQTSTAIGLVLKDIIESLTKQAEKNGDSDGKK